MSHEEHALQEVLYQRRDQLHEIARKILEGQGLAHLDPTTDLVEPVTIALVKYVEEGKLVVADVEDWAAVFGRFVFNEARNRRRANRRLRFFARAEEFPVSLQAEEAFEAVLEEVDRQRLLEMIKMLPPRLRWPVVARVDGVPTSAAAAEAGATPERARQLIDELRTKIATVAGGGRLRGADKDAITEFARAALAWRDQRNGHE